MSNYCENCGKCCIETEMILSFEDIELIKKNSIDNIGEGDFVFKNENERFQLKNIDGHCVFLNYSAKKCKIYEFRPQGCRFYPLIYDLNTYKCKLDDDCPRKEQFYTTKQSLEDACSNLERFLRNKLNLKI
ncbi:hypothetical protein ES703_65757 [subsurface metagenome]